MADDKEWEKNRDNRVAGWRSFKTIQNKRSLKSGKKSGIHAPQPKV